MGKIFFDFNGDFQWASVAAIVAVFGALVSLIFSFLSYRNTQKSILIQKEMDQKKIDADIISKSRMHWIDNTKMITSTFITDSLSLGANFKMFTEKIVQYNEILINMRNLREMSINKKIPQSERNKAKEEYEYWINEGSKTFNRDMQNRVNELNELLKKNSNSYMLIKLNFSNNDENNEVVELASKIYEGLKRHSLKSGWDQFASKEELVQSQKNVNKVFKENSLNAEKFTELLRDYYKREWEKVKIGK
ncbi:hypothetical protein P7D31_00685 [Enterococcus dongliensis]|jgi:hypothetical protein|nr:hypothetical protein [Enterococcus dongliensis]MDT2638631.1 hypothetical protein [Enterococcus dongliensis]